MTDSTTEPAPVCGNLSLVVRCFWDVINSVVVVLVLVRAVFVLNVRELHRVRSIGIECQGTSLCWKVFLY